MGYLNGYTFHNLLHSPHDMEFTDKGFPILKEPELNSMSYNICGWNTRNSAKINPSEYILHFYLEDYMFEGVWNKPTIYINKLKQFGAVMQPDFSLYTDMPKPMQQWNHYRKQWIASYWQLNGIKVIPTICWSDEQSFDFCFEGVPKNSVVTTSYFGCAGNEEYYNLFLKGYLKMMEELQPSLILLYGTGKNFKSLPGNICIIDSKAPFLYKSRKVNRLFELDTKMIDVDNL